MGSISRRQAMLTTGALALGAALPRASAAAQDEKRVIRNGRIKQSVARWCFDKVPLKELCKACAEMGMPAVDLLNLDEWSVAKDHGLVVSTGWVDAGTIEDGLNDRKNHDGMVRVFETAIPKAAAEGVPNVVCFFGNRRGMSDAEGIDNSVACLDRVKKLAEERKASIVIEVLNSKVDHADYIGDNTPYALKVVKAVDSPRVKILYDIYHMQIMEGDVIRTIQDNHAWFAHYHTGGVPGRAEIGDTQELYYPAIVRAILDTGFDAYMAHEFIPQKPDPIRSLREAAALCDV
jgi:hydroxypyruvate isomerase